MRLFRFKFQMQKIVMIDHNTTLIMTTVGRSQMIPINAVIFENKNAKNTNNNSEVRKLLFWIIKPSYR